MQIIFNEPEIRIWSHGLFYNATITQIILMKK